MTRFFRLFRRMLMFDIMINTWQRLKNSVVNHEKNVWREKKYKERVKRD